MSALGKGGWPCWYGSCTALADAAGKHHLQDIDEYRALYERSIKDPAGEWVLAASLTRALAMGFSDGLLLPCTSVPAHLVVLLVQGSGVRSRVTRSTGRCLPPQDPER